MIRKRGNKWAVTLHDPTTKGKQWVGTFATKSEAKDAEASALLARRRHGKAETVGSFAGRWMADYARNRKSTNDHYAERVKAFTDEFANRRMDSISRVEARDWVLGNRSRHGAVRAMFSDAMRDGITDHNPFTNMRLPQSKGRKELLVPTVELVDRLIESARKARGPIFAAFVTTAAYSGMRPGELYALDWENVDFAAGDLRVVRSYSAKAREFTTPKNHNPRLVVMHPRVDEALRSLPRTLDAVFTTNRGKRLDGRTIHYYWDSARNGVQRPDLALYSMRHFAATMMLDVGRLSPSDVALQLGHTDGGVLVQKLYGHPAEGLARQRIREAFGSNNVVPIRRSGSGTVAG